MALMRSPVRSRSGPPFLLPRLRIPHLTQLRLRRLSRQFVVRRFDPRRRRWLPWGLTVIVQSTTDGMAWTDLPPAAIKLIPGDDDTTAVYEAALPLPPTGPLLLRIAVIRPEESDE